MSDSFVSLNDLYVSTGGGVIEGDLEVSGNLDQPTFNALMKALTTAYSSSLDVTVTAGDNYSSVTGKCVLVGNQLRCSMEATRSSAYSAGDITNEIVCSFTIDTKNKVKSCYSTSFINSVSGSVASFYTANVNTTDGVITFDVKLCATASSGSMFNTFWSMPATLNLNGYM